MLTYRSSTIITKTDSSSALITPTDHWISVFGIPDHLLNGNENDFVNGELFAFFTMYNPNHKIGRFHGLID